MSKGLADFQARLDILLKDAAANLSQGDKDAAVAQAAVLYSNDRPLVRVADLIGAGSFDLSLPTGWVDGFSRIKLIEYPYHSTDPEPPTLEDDDWAIYQGPTGKVLRLLNDVPTASEIVRVRFTAPHQVQTRPSVVVAAAPGGAVRASNVVTLTTETPHGAAPGDEIELAGVGKGSFDGNFVAASAPTNVTVCYPQVGTNETSGGGQLTIESTVPESDFEALCNLAASLAFLQLAALKVQTGDPTVGADVVEYRTKSDQYRAMAKEHRQLYNQQVAKGGEVSAASGTANLNVDLSVGLDRLTHPRRTQ